MASGICFTVAEVKARLGITGTAYDASLSSVGDEVNGDIIEFLGFDPTESEITECYDTKGKAEIGLRRSPVTEVASVYLDENGNYGDTEGSFASATLLTPGADYSWAYTAGDRKVGVLRRINALWPYRMTFAPNRLAPTLDVCPGCVKVVYTIDNTRVLAVAKEMGLLEMAAVWAMRQTGHGAMLSETVDGLSRSVTPFQPRTSKIAGDNFVSPVVAVKLSKFRITPMR